MATTLNTPQGKGKQVVDDSEGTSSRSKKKKKDKRRRGENLVAARPKNNPPKDHFEKFLEAPCTNHEVPGKHVLKDCRLLKSFVAGTLKKRTTGAFDKSAKDPHDDDEPEWGTPRRTTSS